MDSPEPLAADAADELTAAVRGIIGTTADELGRARLSPARMAAQGALWKLGRRRDYRDIITGVDRLTTEIDKIGEILRRCASELRAEEERVACETPGGDVWWSNRLHTVARALTSRTPDSAHHILADAWVDGLAAENWDWCRRLLALPDVPPASAEGMRAVTEALTDGKYAGALDPIDAVLDLPMSDGAAVRLGVLRTRILSREFSDREMIRHAAEQAVTRAGRGSWESLALAGLAETQLAADDVEAARTTIARMTRATGPARTDARVVSGLLRERDRLWALADELYDQAVADDPDATRPVLLRPVPPRLLICAAVAPATTPADSLELLQRALDEGVPGDDDSALREIYEVRADRLTVLADEDEKQGRATRAGERRREAADSLAEAARRYSLAQLPAPALDCLRRACELAPGVARFHWSYGEELRLDALHADGTIDLPRMEQARDELHAGLQMSEPGDAEAWVLVSLALADDALGGAGDKSAVLIERTLLRDPDYAAAYGFLARVLRRRGFHQEAFEAMTAGREATGGSQRVLFEEQVELLLDRGEFDDAIGAIELQSLLQPGDEDYVAYRADVLLRRHEPEEALAALSGQEPTNWVRLVRGQALFETGQPEAARAEFWTLWTETAEGPAGDVAGWAAYRAGLLDEGITRYEDRVARAPAYTPYSRDLGQMLLVRGDHARGAGLLIEGIERCPSPGELRYLAESELGYVRQAVLGLPHEAEVARILDDARGRIERRRRELLEARRDPADLDAALGAARAALHEGHPTEALELYRTMLGDDRVPEVAGAVVRAARRTLAAADRRYAAGRPEQARDEWAAAERAVGGEPDLVRSLICRRMVADLHEGNGDELAAWLEKASGEAGAEGALTDAVRTLAFDATHLWSLRDGLLAMRDRPGASARARQLIDHCAERLPLGDVYGLGRDAAAGSSPRFVNANQLELRLGALAHGLSDSSELNAATADLRRRVEADTGVLLPWIYAVPDDEVPDRYVDVQVYFRSVGGLLLPRERAQWVPAILAELETRVRDYLFRLVGVDDVALWLKGWEPESADGPAWDPPDPRADRLRLARVLRMLLREGVSVGDRGVIVSRVRNPRGGDTRGESATLETLRGVREGLGARSLGVGPDTEVAPLPAELEKMVAEGLRRGSPLWELPRRRAYAIVTDLRSWLREQPRWPEAVSVADPHVRPFVWRLLAAERPAVRVLSESELSHD